MKIIKISIVILFLGSAFFLGAAFFLFHNKCIDFSVLENYKPRKPSILLDDEGKEWARFELVKREPAKLEDMPKHLINAFIAAEDWAFFKHSGISWKGIVRSFIVNLYKGRKAQGASTITQQLIRLLFLTPSKTFKRKLKEQIFALLVEKQFTKEQILELFLNNLYLGHGVYGVNSAAQLFWGKSINELSLDESAILAGIIRSPRNYSPILAPKSSEKRRNIVLSQMLKLQFISKKEFEKAKSKPIKLTNFEKTDIIAPYLKETIRIFLEDLLGKEKLYSGGLKIQTTINLKMQKTAEKCFALQINKLKETLNEKIDGAMLTMDVKTGEIKTMIGGVDFKSSKYNRALQAKRQLGSIFKPIVYASALKEGIKFSDTDIDEPLKIIYGDKIWEPKNHTRRFEGRMTLARALSISNNIIAIKTFLKIGSKKITNLAKKFKIKAKLHSYPSLALGSIDGTLIEVLGLFNVFANNGIFIEPHYIRWVKNEFGFKIWKKDIINERVIDSKINDQVAKILSLGMNRMKKSVFSNWINAESIGKTGTTNDSRTCWFAGATPEYTTALYIGCDDNSPLGIDIFGVKTALPIWVDFYRNISLNVKNFSFDYNLKEIFINWITGEEVSDLNQPNSCPILIEN